MLHDLRFILHLFLPLALGWIDGRFRLFRFIIP